MDPKSAVGVDPSLIGIGRPHLDGGFEKPRATDPDPEAARVARDATRELSGSTDSRSGSESKTDDPRVSESEVLTDDAGSAAAASDYPREIRKRGGFQRGDMVWGKVKSHPWWPGFIFNESFASASVRRTKREGHELVAFYGDSSYGWFEHSELIPFDPNFAEKSKQTSSRPFLKAVEEAVDEASRRGALALACCCKDQFRIRPTDIPGYHSVNILGYEPGAFYSSGELRKARDEFVPTEVLSFVRQLALSPRGTEPMKDIYGIRSMARLLAYRRAVFEAFDETYAQAFGVEPVRPSRNESSVQDQAFAPRALSGPLVIAETLGNKKSSSSKPPTRTPKHTTPSSTKKNKYLLKRRNEVSAVGPRLLDHRPTNHKNGASTGGNYSFDLAPGRQPQASSVIPSLQAFREAATAGTPISTATTTDVSGYVLQKRSPVEKHPIRSAPEMGKDSVAVLDREMEDINHDPVKNSLSPMLPGSTTKLESGETKIGLYVVDSKEFTRTDMPKTSGISQPKLETPSMQAPELTAASRKLLKRQAEAGGEVKKIKKKKTKDIRDKDPQRKVVGPATPQPETSSRETSTPTVPLVKLDLDNIELQFPQLVSDLSALAMDPFHGIELGSPDIVRHIFLRFRSLVYSKSLVAPTANETEAAYARPVSGQSPIDHGIGISNVVSVGDSTERREHPLTSKPKKPAFWLDDPTKSGRKRAPSDRQEEISAKKVKKMKQIKALAGEKKAVIVPKSPEEETAAAEAAEPVEKKEATPAPQVPEPTYLVMKFPPRTTLPSVTSLKAKFGRFGVLGLEGTRVLYKTHSCRVLFKFKVDAEKAYNHARNNDIFGLAKIQYSLREFEAPTAAEPVRQPQPPNGNTGYPSILGVPPYQQRLSSGQFIKSILKKPGEELGPTKESPRVKFNLGGDDSRRGPSVVVVAPNTSNESRNPKYGEPPLRPRMSNSSVFRPEFGRLPSSPPLPPPPPLPPVSLPPIPQFPLPPSRSVVAGFVPPVPRHHRSFSSESEGWERSKGDISHQMLRLLVRCSDIVGSVRSALGYEPYHPL